MRSIAFGVIAFALVSCAGSDSGKEPTAGSVVEVGSAVHTPYNLSTASGGGLVAIAWNDYDDEAAVETPMVAVSTDGGVTFRAPVQVDPTDPYVAYPQVAVDSNGTLFVGVTLYEENEGDGRAALYRSTDQGATFELVADLTEAPRVAFGEVGTTIAVSPDGGTVVMAWSEPNEQGANGRLVGLVSTDGGSSFGEVAELSAQAGNGRPRAFAGESGAGVVGIELVPLPDPPAPTPAEPNPITATPQTMLYAVSGDGFGSATQLTDEDPTALDKGPAVATDDGPSTAWWVDATGGAMLVGSTVGDDGGDSASPLLTSPLLVPASVEAATTGDDVWYLTIAVPEGDETAPAPLVLIRRHGDGNPEEVTAVTPLVARSGEEYDITALEDSAVLVAWFGDGVISAQTVSV